jgi:hypothetical protein
MLPPISTTELDRAGPGRAGLRSMEGARRARRAGLRWVGWGNKYLRELNLASMARSTSIRALRFTILLALVSIFVACGKPPEPKPIFRIDLHPFGFLTEARGRIIGNFTDITFYRMTLSWSA